MFQFQCCGQRYCCSGVSSRKKTHIIHVNRSSIIGAGIKHVATMEFFIFCDILELRKRDTKITNCEQVIHAEREDKCDGVTREPAKQDVLEYDELAHN